MAFLTSGSDVQPVRRTAIQARDHPRQPLHDVAEALPGPIHGLGVGKRRTSETEPFPVLRNRRRHEDAGVDLDLNRVGVIAGFSAESPRDVAAGVAGNVAFGMKAASPETAPRLRPRGKDAPFRLSGSR